jgi:hypothetical protein
MILSRMECSESDNKKLTPIKKAPFYKENGALKKVSILLFFDELFGELSSFGIFQ